MAGSYLKSLQLAKQLEERAKEATKNKELAEKEFTSLEQFLKVCKECDVDLTEVEKPQMDFEASMASKDYQSALAHVRKAKEAANAAYLRKIAEVGDSVAALVALIQGAGSEAKSALELLDKSKERASAEDLEQAMKLAKNAYDAAERTVHELLSQLFSQAQETIMQAKEIGDDVALFEDMISRARASLDGQEYEACLSQIKEVLEGAGEDLKSQIGATISRAEELVAAGEELKADVSRVKNHMERAKAALASLKFKESLGYAKKAEADGESAIASRFQELQRETRESIKKMKNAKEDVSVPQQLLDQAQSAMKEKKYIEALHALTTSHDRVRQMQFDAVLSVIQEARDKFVLAKKVGVDMTKAVMFLNTSRDNLNLDKFEEAINYAEQAKKEIDRSLEQFYNARDHVVELAKAVKTAADMGADPAHVKTLLADARKKFEARDYLGTVSITDEGIAQVKKLSYESAMALIDDADKAVKVGKAIGADMTEAEGVLQRAIEQVNKEFLSECVTLARSSKEAAYSAMTRVMSDKLQSLDQFVRGYPGQGFADVPEMITRARQLMASYEFEKAQDILKEVTGKIESVGESECERIISTASTKIEVLRVMEGDVSDLEILLTRAKDELDKKVYEDATARAREVIEHANEQITKIVQAEYSSARDAVEEAKTLGIEVEDALDSVKYAGLRMGKQENDEAFKILKDTKAKLKESIAKYDTVKSKIHRAEDLISEAAKTRSDVTGLNRTLDSARRAFSAGQIEDAESQLDECISQAERGLGMYLAAKFILSSKESIELAEAHNIEIGPANELLGKAKELMKAKNYDLALSTAKQCDEKAREILTGAVTDGIKDLQRLLTDARNVGVDTVGAEKLAEKAISLARKNDFGEALKCLSSATEDINHVKTLSSQAAVEIRVARGNLKDAETLDMDVGRAHEFLRQAVEALTRHQYAIALELAKKSSEASSEVSKNRIRDTLDKFKEKVDKAAAEGLNLGMSERFVAEGLAAFDEGKYQDALKLAMKCEQEMERAELQRDISQRAVEMARRKIETAVADGTNSEKLTELVDRAASLFREGKYVEALTAAIESGDELYTVREGVDKFRIDISSLREKVDRLKKVNIDTSECDEDIEMAEDFLASRNFSKCADAIRRCTAKAGQLFESSIKDVMQQNRLMIEKAKAMGIDTKECDNLLEMANTSFSESLWDYAYQQSASCRDTCLALITKKMSGLVEGVEKKAGELRRQNAATGTIEDLLRDSKSQSEKGDPASAFNTLLEAERRVAAVEDAHKKYTDISIAAESAIENLGRFGLSRREPERLVAMADIEKDNDYDSAIELLAEALNTAKEQMETYSPNVGASISATGLQQDSEGILTLTVRNSGRAVAKDVTFSFEGEVKVVESPAIALLKPETETTIPVRLVPKAKGSVPIKVTITAKRPIDSRLITAEAEDSVNVFPAGPPFRIGRASDTTRCISCQGRIKAGFDIVTCRCGGQLHLSCAKRTGVCPVCGQKYSF